MRDYDGPVFNEGHKKIENRRFGHQSQRMDSGRLKFEPAYKAKKIPINDNQGRIDEVRLEQDYPVVENSLTSPTSAASDYYEIPFLKKQDKSKKTVDNSNVPSPEDGFMDYRARIQNDEDKEQSKPLGGRENYVPSYQVKNRENKEKRPFKATELPKPYKKTETKDNQSNEDTRELSKRLHKTKDSFLLFENGEAIKSNDE